MKLLYIGYILEESQYLSNPAAMISAGIFEEGLIYEIKEQVGSNLTVFSVEPNRYYPKGPLFSQKKKSVTNRGIIIKSIPYVNIQGLRQLSSFFALNWNVLKWSIENRNDKRIVLHYNLGIPINQVMLVMKPLLNGIYPIVCDFNCHGKSTRLCKKVINSFIENNQIKAIKRADGIIALNINLLNDFQPKSGLIMEGAISPSMEQYNDVDTVTDVQKKVNIRYAGTVDESHGALTLIEVAKCLNNEYHCTVQIAGKIFNCNEILDASNAKDIPLEYIGVLERKEATEFAKEADILIIPHSTRFKQLRYQFSSKMFDYMACKKPVIVSPMDGFPDEYRKFVFVADRDDAVAYVEQIRIIMDMPKEMMEKRLTLAREFVLSNRTWKAQARRILQFIDN